MCGKNKGAQWKMHHVFDKNPHFGTIIKYNSAINHIAPIVIYI